MTVLWILQRYSNGFTAIAMPLVPNTNGRRQAREGKWNYFKGKDSRFQGIQQKFTKLLNIDQRIDFTKTFFFITLVSLLV